MGGDPHKFCGSVSLASTPNADVDTVAAELASVALASKPWQAVAAVLHQGLHPVLVAIASRLHRGGDGVGVRH